MIEQWEHSARIVSFKLSVKILFCINVNKTYTSTSIVVVFVAIENGHLIVVDFECFDIKEKESILGIDLVWFVVDDNFMNIVALKIESEFRWDLIERESYLRKSGVMVSGF